MKELLYVLVVGYISACIIQIVKIVLLKSNVWQKWNITVRMCFVYVMCILLAVMVLTSYVLFGFTFMGNLSFNISIVVKAIILNMISATGIYVFDKMLVLPIVLKGIKKLKIKHGNRA